MVWVDVRQDDRVDIGRGEAGHAEILVQEPHRKHRRAAAAGIDENGASTGLHDRAFTVIRGRPS